VAAKQFTKEERTAPGKPETNNNQVIAKTGDTALSNLAKVTLPQTHGADANANIIAGANNRARTAIHKPDAIIDNDPYSKSLTTQVNKKVRFGIYAATFFNYAKGSSNQVNVGAGVTTDISITRNLTLSTGVALAQNTLAYTILPTTSANVAYQSVLPQNDYSTSPTGSATPTTFSNYNASLVALDIPVNLKYEFDPDKHTTYILAGLSSGTFVNETYTYGYESGQKGNASVNKSFGNFYFAKTLNVSFGFGYPLSKTNSLIIEPFLKYPLDGLGAQDLKFGAGGVNLKFSIASPKK
jgi:hypothetical protein